MSEPDWRTSTAGTKIRAALWLVQVIGEGGTFRKVDLREAFPDTEQIDRRVRDLRDDGWLILTQREDASLAVDELRLASVGGHVWEQRYRRPDQEPRLTPQQRQAVLSADEYMCRSCGVAGGEPFPDDPRPARLTIARFNTEGQAHWLTLCNRCLAGRNGMTLPNPESLTNAVAGLSPEDLRRLQRWLRDEQRVPDPAERLWMLWRRLPADHRAKTRQLILQG